MRTAIIGPFLCVMCAASLCSSAGPTTRPAEKSTFLQRLDELAKDGVKVCEGVELFWKDAPGLRSSDGQFSVKVGGKIHADIGWIDADDLGKDIGIRLKHNTEYRRMEPYVSGQFFENLEFKLEGEFAGRRNQLKDAYLRVKRLPYLGSVTVGHIKEPFNMDELTSSKSIALMERALPNAFAPKRAFGVMANNHALDQRMTWAAGVFRQTDHYRAGSTDRGSAHAFTGRVTALPVYKDEGKKLVHLGGAYSLRRPIHRIRFRQRPEAHFTRYVTNTGRIDADHLNLYGTEAALVDGPFWMQGEYIAAVVDPAVGANFSFNGIYVQAGYFLTGEHRPYDRRKGVFSRVRPKKDFLRGGGGGAWEVAGRYSFLDLDDNYLPASARTVQNATVGLNWYLNPYMRIMWNYVHSWVDGSDTKNGADMFIMRFQLAF